MTYGHGSPCLLGGNLNTSHNPNMHRGKAKAAIRTWFPIATIQVTVKGKVKELRWLI